MIVQNLLLIDDDSAFIEDLKLFLEPAYSCSVCSSISKAKELLDKNHFDLILLDIKLNEKESGLDFLQDVRQFDQVIPIMMVSRYNAVEKIVEAIKKGANDYITKPVKYNELMIKLERIFKETALRKENIDLREQLKRKEMPVFSRSKSMQKIVRMIDRIADQNIPVLICGETGVGKEVVARYIHRQSARKKSPFFLFNCSTIPESLIESALFGHEKGAFTGALKKVPGMFEQADQSTLLLDEIGDLRLSLQAKLLNVLESSEFYRLGGEQPVRSDVRILFATNKDLKKLVKQKEFREDLWYRINMLRIEVPPLRERTADIEDIAAFYLDIFSHIHVKSKPVLSSEATHYLKKQSWPGNIRQLRNVLERVIIFSESERIELKDIRQAEDQEVVEEGMIDLNVDYNTAKKAVLTKFQNTYLSAILRKTNGNITKAAKIMGLARPSLQRLLKDKKVTK